MSSVLVVQTKQSLFMGSDSAISTTIEDKTYRIGDNGKKIFIVSDYLIFCSGNLITSYEIMQRFYGSPLKTINLLRNIAINTYQRQQVSDNNLDIIAARYENGRTIVYQISPYNEFEIIKREVDSNNDIGIWVGGIKTQQAYGVALKSLQSRKNLVSTYQAVFDEISYEGVGGILTVYKLDENGIATFHQNRIKEKTIKYLSDLYDC